MMNVFLVSKLQLAPKHEQASFMETKQNKRVAPAIGATLRKGTKSIIRAKREKAKANSITTFQRGFASVKFEKKLRIHVEQHFEQIVNPVDIEVVAKQLTLIYKRVCKLHDVKALSLKGLEPEKVYNIIYSHVLEIMQAIDKQTELNIEKDDKGNFFLVAYRIINHNDIIYLLPLEAIDILQKTNSQLADAIKDVFSMLIHKIGYDDFSTNSRVESIIENYKYEIQELEEANSKLTQEEDPYEDDEVEMKELDVMNHTEGPAAELISDIIKRKSIVFNKRFTKPQTDIEEKLLQWYYEAEAILFSEHAKPISVFEYDNEEPEEYMDKVSLSDLFIIMWNDTTQLYNDYIQWVNMDEGEYGRLYPTKVYVMNKRTNQQYRQNKQNYWFEAFIIWLDKGAKIMYQIIENNNKQGKNERTYKQLDKPL